MVFRNKKVGNFINNHFVSLRVYWNKNEGHNFREKYDVRGTPTVLFLNSTGEEIDRITGFNGNKDAYFKTINDYTFGKNTLGDILSKFQNDSNNVAINFLLAMKYTNRWESEKAQKYFTKVLQLDPADEKGFKVESMFHAAAYEARINKNIKPLQLFMASNSDRSFFDLGYYNLIRYYKYAKDTNMVIEIYEEAIKKMPTNTNWMNNYARDIFQFKIESLYDRGIELTQQTIKLNRKAAKAGYYNLARYYKNVKNTDKLIETYEEAVKKIPNNAGLMNGYAWSIYENKLKTKYNRGIELALKAIKIEPEAANIWDTLGWLYYETGDRKQAIKFMKKAIELEPEREYYKKNLKKFEKGVS